MATIFYSRGVDQFDNRPAQNEAADFNDFAEAVLKDRSPRKGMAYICGALSSGVHYQHPEKYPGADHWRLKNYALKRRFLAFDFDGFASPEVFGLVCKYFDRWNCLIYTTASHTTDKPRARAIVELDRDVDDEEGVRLGEAAQRCLEKEFGEQAINFDRSVYRATQPLFTPVTASLTFRHKAEPLSVDAILRDFPGPMKASKTQVNELTAALMGVGFELPKEKVCEGMRNETMIRYVGQIRKRGFKEDEILVLALAMNSQRFAPPLPEQEVSDICNRYSHQTKSDGRAQLKTYSSVEMFLANAGVFQVPVTPPARRDYVFAGQATAGTLNVIGGQGGVSKTMLMMQVCVAAAVGTSIGSLSISAGASMLFLGEEDETERDRRMGAICQHFNADKTLVQQRVKCFGAAGIDIRLTQKVESNAHATAMGEEVIEAAKAHSKESGVPIKVIVFDHARLVLGGDPNSAEDVTQLTRVLTNIARSTGAAVILLAHSPKSVANKSGSEIGAADIAGSSAFVDNARSAYMMWTMREEEAKLHHITDSERLQYVRLENVKANYAQTGGGYWFRRKFLKDWDVAVLEQVALFSPNLFESKRAQALRDLILAELRKRPGGVTERFLRDMAGKSGILKASDASVRKEVQAMLEDALIERRKPSEQERRQHRLAGGVREVLAPITI